MFMVGGRGGGFYVKNFKKIVDDAQCSLSSRGRGKMVGGRTCWQGVVKKMEGLKRWEGGVRFGGSNEYSL